ncbi:hypothetical protein I4552_22875 [Klebsiella michiganensis]|uniref:hypothetical protein n=1 Tax=Klebsiella michiganensis TaxID=1134687 RepID=UPI0018C702BA|nr:hypothetical protein [Klebsiella michiganensis]MBG2622125.1 hypothetical protein [Klebsiella michiganensis]MBG2633840.1 hypothetical protein [Klebsiella michiganensis]
MNIETVNELIQSLESAGELSIKERKYLELAKAYQQLAAENVGLKKFIQTDCFVGHIEPETFHEEEVTRYVSADGYEPETPATDRIVAGIKADGRAEGINFAAGRLAAAFNHGFVDKPMAEVFDVVRMILTAKEDLANDPAADGLSGEYAEKSLAEWEAALREGADK